MDKVIEFPKHKVVRDVPGEVLEERNRKADMKMADALVDDLAGIIVTELDNFDIDIENKTFSKDFIVVVDALKAAIYRTFGLEHRFHEFTDKNISVFDADFGNLPHDEIKERIEAFKTELAALAEKAKVDSETGE